MVRSVVVLPSPLVGASVYRVLAQAFGVAGVTVEVADFPAGVASGAEVLNAFGRAVARARPDLVVAHSNAGLVAPAVADGTPVVFVDAALPPPEGECTMAPPGMLTLLVALAEGDGLLPPWTQWWAEDDVGPLFPDPEMRRDLEPSIPRLPLGYFRSTVRAPSGWEAGPCAYLAFGATYAVELARARRLGWPTAELVGARHLHFLHDPRGVVDHVLHLAGRAAGGAGVRTSV